MKTVCLWTIAGVLILGGRYCCAFAAEVRPLAFLHALQKQGYGDVAVDYLKLLNERGDLPQTLRDTWDLEMSRSLRAAAQDAYNAKEQESLMQQAEEHLAKFIQEKPNHPQAGEAVAMLADFSLDQALKNLRAAKIGNDKSQQAKYLDQARSALQQARSRLKEVGKKYQAELDAMLPLPTQAARREDRETLARYKELQANLWNIRLQDALIDYYLAQTYSDPYNAERKAFLKTAAKAFDAIFQTNRMEVIGLLAHMWHGKTMEELGDWQTALDIYDEVLVNAPEPGEVQKDAELQPLFAQVQHYRMQILARHSPDKFLNEAGQWVREYRKTQISQSEAFQAIALELAKAQLAAAENAPGSEKAKLVAAALKLLAEICQVRSPYQQEAILLRRQYLQSADKSTPPESFEAAMALAEAAAIDEQWERAAAEYELALKFADREKVADSLRAEVRNSLANTLYMQARNQLLAGKWEQCIAAAKRVVGEYKETPAAPPAASLAVSAALNLYVVAPGDKKEAALERLQQLAKYAAATWPDKPEADEARMMLAQASLAQGKIDQALAVFEKIDPRSDRYPNALALAAETYWRRYLAEKAKPETGRNQSQMQADHDKALSNLELSLRLQRKKIELHAPLPGSLIETQLLLAEILLADGKAQDAADLLQPLVDTVQDTRPENIDNTIVRTFVDAVRAYLAQDNLPQATAVGTNLAEWGPDLAEVNNALLELVNVLGEKYDQAEAELAAVANTVNVTAVNDARAKLKSVTQSIVKLLAKTASRERFSLPATLYLADMCQKVGMDDAAREICLRVANQAEKDPAYAKRAGKSLTWVRVRLLELLAKNGDFQEAHKQAAQLAAANPRALEPLMQQGRILQAWSETDPSHYKETVEHWAKLRGAMLGMIKKPPEYYEVTYNLATALYGQACNSNDNAQIAENAKQAQQLLKSTLVLSPNLSGPEMVARYKALLKKVAALQDRSAAR
jgi:hypothetical protein